MQMQMDPKPVGSPLEYARRLAGNNAQIQPLRVNGLSGARIDLPGSIAAVVYLDQQAFIFQGVGKNRQILNEHSDAMLDTVRSVHVLTAEERKAIRPLGIRIIIARQGDTYARLAQNSPLGKSAESYLRLINAQYPDGEPLSEQRIKIVE